MNLYGGFCRASSLFNAGTVLYGRESRTGLGDLFSLDMGLAVASTGGTSLGAARKAFIYADRNSLPDERVALSEGGDSRRSVPGLTSCRHALCFLSPDEHSYLQTYNI